MRRISCIGDSITFGAGVFATRKTDAWPALWQKQLGEKFQVLNYGVSGATLQEEGDFPYRKYGFLDRLKKASPELIVLMLGTNDSKPYNWNASRYEREYEELLSELLALPWKHQVALMIPPKAFEQQTTEVVAFDIRNSVIRDYVQPVIAAIGEKHSLPVIDLYTLTEDHPEYFDDGAHPNLPGNKAIADYVCGKLKDCLI